MKKQTIINLIDTVIGHGQDATWCDSDIIEQLIDCGLTEQDFIEYGFGDFVADYFKEPDEYVPSSTNGDYSPSNPWDAPGMYHHLQTVTIHQVILGMLPGCQLRILFKEV